MFALAATGPGNWSIGHAAGLSMHGVAWAVVALAVHGVEWAVVALAVGLLGGMGAVVTGRAYAHEKRRRPPRATRRPTTA